MSAGRLQLGAVMVVLTSAKLASGSGPATWTSTHFDAAIPFEERNGRSERFCAVVFKHEPDLR